MESLAAVHAPASIRPPARLLLVTALLCIGANALVVLADGAMVLLTIGALIGGSSPATALVVWEGGLALIGATLACLLLLASVRLSSRYRELLHQDSLASARRALWEALLLPTAGLAVHGTLALLTINTFVLCASPLLALALPIGALTTFRLNKALQDERIVTGFRG